MQDALENIAKKIKNNLGNVSVDIIQIPPNVNVAFCRLQHKESMLDICTCNRKCTNSYVLEY